MHLKGKEKHFWKNNFGISKLADIPLEISGYKSIDSETDDQFLEYLTSRIPTIHGIYLKFTNITDEGVRHISKIASLSELTLRDHKDITNESVPYLNQLADLVYLDLVKTKIGLKDLPGLFQLQKLKELYVSTEEENEEILLEHVAEMKKILPQCILYINYRSYE
ncbi:hypothetical protein MH928_12995 [Flavobacterium sp. WW92]|uniref:hypothetical protein n=1 Tax=unclassified Flavobacterium TaxID=196869 RepID=UPI00222519B3|nr:MULTISPECIES: hypothetical protein [unclassified Flavobacterium]WDO12240.1 hypothetical protein MH928_12995 [Flavobacterium sp. WW92]